MTPLPFEISARVAERGQIQLIATLDGRPIAMERYAPGDGDRRRKLAARWADDKRLWNGAKPDLDTLVTELERVELEALATVDALEQQCEVGTVVDGASYVDSGLAVELAWSRDSACADFIVCERGTGKVSRAATVDTAGGKMVVPGIASGIVTPGGSVQGAVFVPTEAVPCDDQETLRADLHSFIARYVELSKESEELAVTYVLLTWTFDAFDELPYLCFRAADCGRGKSRALEAVGAVCYRPMFVGGGSSAAATLRMLDIFGGTLVADEFDQRRDSELTADLIRILNQGFQRGRPLVKCCGEDNQPRPFRCYGPKVFALRRGFGDDATESRTVSVHMCQRTRADLPLNLPRARFDAEALALRNHLLGWRFATLGTITIDPTLADPELEDRANQIGLPLLAVAGNADRRTMIVAALRNQQASIAADRAESLAGEVYAVVVAVVEPDGTVRPGAVSAEVNRRRAEADGVEPDKLRRAVTSHKVGRIVAKELELPSGGRDRRGAFYVADPERMRQLCLRFGGRLPETSQTSHRHTSHQTSHENGLFDGASGVCDDCDDCVLPVTNAEFAESQTSHEDDGPPPDALADLIDGGGFEFGDDAPDAAGWARV